MQPWFLFLTFYFIFLQILLKGTYLKWRRPCSALLRQMAPSALYGYTYAFILRALQAPMSNNLRPLINRVIGNVDYFMQEYFK